MEINLLVLSLNNTRLGIATFSAGELHEVVRIVHGQRGDWPARIGRAWASIAARENAAVVAASVNPPLESSLELAVREATGQPIQWIGRDIDLPIKVLTEKPEETGVDRILNIAAAYEQMGKACVVVDAGTAITVDCCDDKGDFLGGAIAPGVAMMLEGMHSKTAKLPRLEFAVPEKALGRSTEQAMLSGVYNGVRGMVKELVESYATELGFWPDIIATGGDAPKLFEGWELIHAVAPDLTFYGIALAYAEHHIKHGA